MGLCFNLRGVAWPAAWLCVLGNLFGIGLHIFAAGIGLSLLLASSDNFLFALSVLGGLYLIYLGASRFRETRFSLQQQTGEYRAYSKREVMTKTALINILNPKVLLLFLTLLPQFAEPGRSFLIQSLAFGFLHACIASLVLFAVIEVFMVAGRRAVAPNATAWLWFNRLGGAQSAIIGGIGNHRHSSEASHELAEQRAEGRPDFRQNFHRAAERGVGE